MAAKCNFLLTGFPGFQPRCFLNAGHPGDHQFGTNPDHAQKRRELAERIWRAIVGWQGGDIIADIESVLAEQEGK